MKLNRTPEEAEEFIKKNLKSFGGPMTQKEVGAMLGVSGPRISQIASGMRRKAEGIPAHVSEFETPVEAIKEHLNEDGTLPA